MKVPDANPMTRFYQFFLPYLLFPLAVTSIYRGGYALSLIPLFLTTVAWMDFRAGQNRSNPDTDTGRQLFRSHNFLISIWVPLQILILLYFLYAATRMESLGTLESVLLAILIGLTISSRGGMVGHELSHRRSGVERLAGEILLSSICYVHYISEHVYVHHSHVATPEDPVTARKGQNFYRYFCSAMSRSLFLAWRYERNRLVRQGLSGWNFRNPFLRRTLMLALWIAACGGLGGIWAIVLFLIQSMAAVLVLRAMDYMQHYGLQRQYDPKLNLWEPIGLHHAWNCNLGLSNLTQFNILRHSDHHHHPAREYPLLQAYPESSAPHLPFSPSILTPIALMPPLWFYIMDPLVDRWRSEFYPKIRDWSPFEHPLYERRPGSARLIGEISNTVPRLGMWMNRQPELLDTTLSTDFANLDFPDDLGIEVAELNIARRGMLLVYYLQELDLQQIGRQLEKAGLQNSEDITDATIDWSNQVIFEACVRVLRRHIFPSDLILVYENIAEIYFKALSESLIHELGINQGTNSDCSFAVIMLDRLDSSWALLGWKFDLVVVYDNFVDAPLPSRNLFSEFARKLHTSIRLLAQGSMMIHPEHNTVGTFTMQELSKKNWQINEECVLTDARVLYAHGDMGKRFQDLRQEILSRECDPEDLAIDLTFAQEDADQKKSFSKPAILSDMKRIRLLIYYLLRIHLKDHPDILAGDFQAILQKLHAHELIRQENMEELSRAMAFLSNAYGALSLVTHDDFDEQTAARETKTFLAHAVDAEDFEALLKHAQHNSASIRRISSSFLS